MGNNRRTLMFLPIVLVAGLFTAQKVLAVCPLCTVAVGAGVGLSRWLGIDDVITGLWIGGLIVSLIAWSENWLDKKNIHFRGRTILTIIGWYVLTLVPLYYAGFIDHPINTLCLCRLDRLLLGTVVGSVAFWTSSSWYLYLKDKNDSHAYFPFQKIIMPVVLLIILSILFYFLTK